MTVRPSVCPSHVGIVVITFFCYSQIVLPFSK